MWPVSQHLSTYAACVCPDPPLSSNPPPHNGAVRMCWCNVAPSWFLELELWSMVYWHNRTWQGLNPSLPCGPVCKGKLLGESALNFILFLKTISGSGFDWSNNLTLKACGWLSKRLRGVSPHPHPRGIIVSSLSKSHSGILYYSATPLLCSFLGGRYCVGSY